MTAALLAMVDGYPCRTIRGERGPYLSRYTLGTNPDGGFTYIHRFHRSDVDRQLHNHPWAGSSIILAGGYYEERRIGQRVTDRAYGVGDHNILAQDTFHRVDLAESECWTLFKVSDRVQDWGFWDRDTGVYTQWEAFLRQRGLL